MKNYVKCRSTDESPGCFSTCARYPFNGVAILERAIEYLCTTHRCAGNDPRCACVQARWILQNCIYDIHANSCAFDLLVLW